MTDLLSDPADQWVTQTPARWQLAPGRIQGSTPVLDGAKQDPAASIFLVSKQVFGGDLQLDIDVSFAAGRYLGVYLDFGQATQSGMWMGTGHALPADSPPNGIERGYIKTVDNSVWIVRATGELLLEADEVLQLRFERSGDQYSMYRDGLLVATYRKVGGYPAGPLQIRLTNAAAVIHRFEVRSEWIE